MTEQLREKIEIMSLVVAILVVLVAIYRYLLNRWRSKIDLREYPYLMPIQGRTLTGVASVSVQCPEAQEVSLHFLDREDKLLHTINEGRVKAGINDFSIDTTVFETGTYYIRLKSKGQVDTRRVEVV